MAHGACNKFGCNCQYYSKSLLTPGLCKTCNHLKDQHNQFMPMQADEYPDDDGTALTSSMVMNASTSTDYVSDHDPLRNRRSKPLRPRLDDYSQQILKKKEDLSHFTGEMWKNKYFESQKEVEFWQTKYNNLYLQYKDLLKEHELAQNTLSAKEAMREAVGGDRRESASTKTKAKTKKGTKKKKKERAQKAVHREPIDLLSGNHSDFVSGNGSGNGSGNEINDTFANWTTFQ